MKPANHTSTLVLASEKYVTNLFSEKLPNTYLYHNLSHTQRVVNSVIEIAEATELTETDKENLIIAAWFHDTGFVEKYEQNEIVGSKIASRFLISHEIDKERITAISDIILATRLGYEPTNVLEKIIKDADNSHFGKKSYFEISELLRKEWELIGIKASGDLEWIDGNINFLTNKHSFYSDYALKNWSQTKDKNIARLLKTKEKLEKEAKKFEQKKRELHLKKQKVDLPERGVETMFRVALRNHITLSDIADTKANILLSVNAIIISVALSNLIPKLDNPSNHYLIYPTLIFMLFTVASIILSVLATRPNVTQGKFSKKDVEDKKVNLLFFGNFHKMKLDEFEWAMSEMMKDRDYLYSSLTKDLYFLGLVLNRKYSLLRLTYTVFMIGMIISVVSFIVAFKFAGN
ncbi:Pycsar system effector family protein [Lacinutrix iliipiscaria]|uniref:Pycsar system effector family protein n=1 Tax=Lacinutrix iliipiscaria TaxID=1230532 RepID=A0ABW5WLR7_9FLAO